MRKSGHLCPAWASAELRVLKTPYFYLVWPRRNTQHRRICLQFVPLQAFGKRLNFRKQDLAFRSTRPSFRSNFSSTIFWQNSPIFVAQIFA